MIQGLRIKVPHTELATHMRTRADFHAEKAEALQKELPGLLESAGRIHATKRVDETDVARMSKVSNYRSDQSIDDVIEQLQQDILNRRNKALAFRYLADHLFMEDYDLTEADLQRLEILNRW